MPSRYVKLVRPDNAKGISLHSVRRHCERLKLAKGEVIEDMKLIGIDLVLPKRDRHPEWHLTQWWKVLHNAALHLDIQNMTVRNLRVLQPDGSRSTLRTKQKKHHYRYFSEAPKSAGVTPLKRQWYKVDHYGFEAHGPEAVRHGMVEFFGHLHEHLRQTKPSPAISTLPSHSILFEQAEQTHELEWGDIFDRVQPLLSDTDAIGQVERVSETLPSPVIPVIPTTEPGAAPKAAPPTQTAVATAEPHPAIPAALPIRSSRRGCKMAGCRRQHGHVPGKYLAMLRGV